MGLLSAGLLTVKFHSLCQYNDQGLEMAKVQIPGFITKGFSKVAVNLIFGAGKVAALLIY